MGNNEGATTAFAAQNAFRHVILTIHRNTVERRIKLFLFLAIHY